MSLRSPMMVLATVSLSGIAWQNADAYSTENAPQVRTSIESAIAKDQARRGDCIVSHEAETTAGLSPQVVERLAGSLNSYEIRQAGCPSEAKVDALTQPIP